MRVLLAGATGVIGRPLLRAMLAAGHEVTALTRRRDLLPALEELGARPSLADVLEPAQVLEAAVRARPEVVVHQLTALPHRIDPRRVATALAPTNRLRSEGTRNLVAAAQAAGARRIVAQSIAFVCAPLPANGPALADEDAPLHLRAPASFRPVIAAVEELERRVRHAAHLEGLALRYGFFYGPGTTYAPGGSMHEDVTRRRIPLVGAGPGRFSFVHLDDAVDATLRALAPGGPVGVLNVVDDHPAPLREWLPAYARALGAPAPRWIPEWLGRLGAGPYGHYLFAELPGVRNDRARAALGWAPRRAWSDEPVLCGRDGA
ncbi:MAG: NAD-dependent epimerase/dehydratase family protein [Planctomycetota bacterium]